MASGQTTALVGSLVFCAKRQHLVCKGDEEVEEEKLRVQPALLTGLPVDAFAELFSSLQQSEIFRAAPTCRTLSEAAALPEVYQCLQVSSVGVRYSGSGRRVLQCGLERLQEVAKLLQQPRFSRLLVLDLRSLALPDLPSLRPLLRHFASCCAAVETLRLGEESRHVKRCNGKLDAQFERTLRRSWPSLTRVEVHGRDGVFPYVISP